MFVRRDGSQSVAAHLAEMNAWLGERGITARELVMLHVLNFQLVFRATFERDEDADAFAGQFG